MEFHLYTCRLCGFESYYLEAMLQHQAEEHPKPETPNALGNRLPASGAAKEGDEG